MSTLTDADFVHPPGHEANWQESVVLVFLDQETGLTGYFRIGTQPNIAACQEWVYLQTPEGVRFRRLRFGLPITPKTRPADGFGAGGLEWRYQGDLVRLKGEYEGVFVDLTYRDFYPSTPCWKWIGSDAVDFGAAAHYESSGAVEGTITIAGKVHRIAKGLGHRDHSWGTRDGANLRACRWCVGTAGPELSHSIFTYFDAKGGVAKGGWVVRHGVVEHAKDIDSVVFNNMDGITARGGRVSVVLESGERIDIALETVSSFITGHDSDHGGPNSYVCSEAVTRTRIGSLTGASCFTVCNNPTGVGQPVQRVCEEFSTLIDGLSTRPDRVPLIRI
jgi:hypothetical protein